MPPRPRDETPKDLDSSHQCDAAFLNLQKNRERNCGHLPDLAERIGQITPPAGPCHRSNAGILMHVMVVSAAAAFWTTSATAGLAIATSFPDHLLRVTPCCQVHLSQSFCWLTTQPVEQLF